MIYNEIKAARNVSYKSASGRIKAKNVQEALDELDQSIIIVNGKGTTAADTTVGMSIVYPEGFTVDNCIATSPLIKLEGGVAWLQDSRVSVQLQQNAIRIQFSNTGNSLHYFKFALIREKTT